MASIQSTPSPKFDDFEADPTLTNDDLKPTTPDQRSFSRWELASLWIGLVVGVPTYYLAGSLVDLGMAWWQGIATVVAANIVLLVPLVLTGHPGTKYGISFPVLARSSFGIHGAHIPTLLRALVGCGWYGIETWIGGEAIFLLLPSSIKSSSFSQLLPWLDKQGGRVESLASIITDCGLHKFNRRLKRCCKIFIPVKDETLDHWFLVVIKLRDKVVEIWDSKADMASLRRRREKATSVILLVQKVFASDMKKPGDIYYNFPSFEVTVPTGNRWDMNGYESGIYMMRHMQFYGEPWYDGFDSSKERTEIALFIVKNSKNEDLKSLRAAAGLSVIGNKKACKLTSIDVEGYMKDEGARPVDNDNNPTGRKMRSHRKRKDPA
ncbi:hypothetical protein ACLB2K_056356 [Fragaria x ananassa]